MKILFWTDGFWPRIGGIETQALQFIEELQKRGHQCIVLAQIENSESKENEIYNGIFIQRFDFNTIFPKKDLKKLIPIQEYLKWITQEFQPDIIHLNVCIGWIAFIFSLFRQMFSMPIALTVHAPFFEENKITPLIVKTASLVDQICCVSKWVMSEMKEHVPQYTHKLRLIYNGISLPEMIPSPLIFSPPTLLLLGRFSSEKGFQTAIEAFFVLKKNHSDARLLIIGEGSERINLENLVNQLNLKNAVTFIGRLDKKEIPIYINQATIAIVPSYLESFGLAALEAMQMGRPVIASEVGGLPEIVSHKKTGLLVPPQDPIALCKAIESLLEQPEKTVQMGMNAREYASTHFTLNENVSQYENLYKNLKNKEPT